MIKFCYSISSKGEYLSSGDSIEVESYEKIEQMLDDLKDEEDVLYIEHRDVDVNISGESASECLVEIILPNASGICSKLTKKSEVVGLLQNIQMFTDDPESYGFECGSI